MAGKGDRPRPGVYSQEFRDNFDKIFGDRRRKKRVHNERKQSKGALPFNVDKHAQNDKNV